GLLLGLGVNWWQSKRPYQQRSVSRLIADLQKKDSPLNLLHQRLWPLLPESLQAVMGGRFAPIPAMQVRLNAAAELRVREPKPTNALPVLRLLLHGPDIIMRAAALEVLQGLGSAAHSLVSEVRALVGDQAGSTVDLRIQAITTLAVIAPDDPAT